MGDVKMRRQVVDLLPPSTTVSRAVLAFLSASHLVFGFAHINVRYLHHPVLWAGFFFVASAACGHAALRFHSIRAVALAGSLCAVAYASRAGALIIAWEYNRATFDLNTLVVAVTAWTTLTVLVSVMFVRGFGPLSSLYRRRQA